MSLEVLISTMNVSSKEELPEGFIWLQRKGIPIVLINQCTTIAPVLLIKEKDILVISEKEVGLSRSRNQAIINSNRDICHFSDDDLKYVADFKLIVEMAYSENPEADIIVFQILANDSEKYNDGEKYKDYGTKKKWLSIMDVAKVSSVEITFKRKSILSKKINFDENFGLGTNFPTGEEFIFLTDAIKKGLKILYLPIPIVIHPLESSGKNFNNKKLIEAKGAMLYRIFGLSGYIFLFFFSLKKYNNSNFSFLNFANYMINGIKKYRQLK
jgi:glycosyl transferase family 2